MSATDKVNEAFYPSPTNEHFRATVPLLVIHGTHVEVLYHRDGFSEVRADVPLQEDEIYVPEAGVRIAHCWQCAP